MQTTPSFPFWKNQENKKGKISRRNKNPQISIGETGSKGPKSVARGRISQTEHPIQSKMGKQWMNFTISVNKTSQILTLYISSYYICQHLVVLKSWL